jgi:hypothetical protein
MIILEAILSMVLVGLVYVGMNAFLEQSFQDSATQILTEGVAQQQIQFAKAVGEYLETAQLTSGATINVATLESAGLLPVGFPASNLLGQTPIAYVGSNSMALATYSQLPSAETVAGLGLSLTSNINMSGLSAKIILRAAADQQPLSYMLVPVEIQGSTGSSPYSGRSVDLNSYFTGFFSAPEPIFAELINMDSAFSGAENQ